jgi:hypothetical protein
MVGPVRGAAVALALAIVLAPVDGSAASKRAHRKHAHHRRGHRSHTGLNAGEATFWDGPTVASGDVEDPSLCGTPAGSCQTYSIHLNQAGARLRAALDTPVRSNTFRFDVIDPSGHTAGSATNSNAFDAEAFVLAPKAGTWKVVVMPQGVSDASYRMRAKLERAAPKPPSGHVPLLPDLRADPPMEFTFVAPANPANGLYPPDTANPPLDVLGEHPLSCTADEMAPTDVQGGAASKCLRFTSGPQNVGIGPFDMRFHFAGDLANGKLSSPIAHGPMFQVIHYGDGSQVMRRAGTYSFHWLHGHFHDDHILDYQLFKVVGHRLVKVGAGTKSGFCPANQLFGDWRSFDQAPPDSFLGGGDTGTGNCQNFVDGVLGLSPGWGDVYRWQRPGQYVDFGTNGDGRYVVRTTVDIENQILESNESNNSSYALVKVVGDSVQLLERGRGPGPFYPRKVVYKGSGPASQD